MSNRPEIILPLERIERLEAPVNRAIEAVSEFDAELASLAGEFPELSPFVSRMRGHVAAVESLLILTDEGIPGLARIEFPAGDDPVETARDKPEAKSGNEPERSIEETAIQSHLDAEQEAASLDAAGLFTPRRDVKTREDLSFTRRAARLEPMVNWHVENIPKYWDNGRRIGRAWFGEVAELARHDEQQAFDALRTVYYTMHQGGRGPEDGFMGEFARYAILGILAERRSDILRPSKCLENQVNISAPLDSLETLLSIVQRAPGTGGARVIASVLCSLYNGNRCKVDLTDLRLLDQANFEHVLNVLRLDHSPVQEIHEYFENGGAIWEAMIADYRLEQVGACRVEASDRQARLHGIFGGFKNAE